VLAPMHNPLNLQGILACERLLPNVPQVAVFDTAFRVTLPEHAFLYAISRVFHEERAVWRYGLHGTSHQRV
jgi:acetate kinase